MLIEDKRQETKQVYISKHNSECKDKAILLMITDGKKWHYLNVQKLSTLLQGITPKHDADYYCISFLHSFKTEQIQNELKLYENVCKNYDYCHIKIFKEFNKIRK